MDEERCPKCDSPNPKWHPAVQFGGEVHTCPDLWHTPPPASAGVEVAHPCRHCNDGCAAIGCICPCHQPARGKRYRAFGIYVSEAGGETICEALGFTREEAEANAVKVAAALNLAHDVAISGVEYDAGKYLTVQIDRETWDELRQFVGRG